jgi:hypothetical protein
MPNGEVYEGEFRQGKRHGRGTYTWSDGRTYNGEFCDGIIQGHGRYTVGNGDVYSCTFVDELRTGLGTCTRPYAPVEYQLWRKGVVYASTNLLELVVLGAVIAVSILLM